MAERMRVEKGEARREKGCSQSDRSTLLASRFSLLLGKVPAVLRQVFGMPDYERYLEHRRARHPGEAVLGPRAFYDQQIKQRYEGGTGRCC